MIEFKDACVIASDYFMEKFGIAGISKIKNGEDRFLFYGGKPGQLYIGGVIVFVMKADGDVGVLEFPSKVSTNIIRGADEIPVPEEYIIS